MSNLGKLIREYRLKQDMSLRDLGNKAGLNHAYISRIERGIGPHPSRKTVLLLAAALNAPTDVFLLSAGYVPQGYAPETLRGAASHDNALTPEEVVEMRRNIRMCWRKWRENLPK